MKQYNKKPAIRPSCYFMSSIDLADVLGVDNHSLCSDLITRRVRNEDLNDGHYIVTAAVIDGKEVPVILMDILAVEEVIENEPVLVRSGVSNYFLNLAKSGYIFSRDLYEEALEALHSEVVNKRKIAERLEHCIYRESLYPEVDRMLAAE